MSKRIVFAGGTDWSVEFLNTLLKEGINIIGVVCSPDSKKDRGQKLATPALKAEAERSNIPVYQPEKLNNSNFVNEINKLKPDLVVVVAYGKLFPKEILEIPPLGFINFHPSLLPKLRGPSPIQSAILEGFGETGVSIMKLGEGMDDGPILAQKPVEIEALETTESLTKKLVELGKTMLPDVLNKYLSKDLFPVPQVDVEATYCKMLQKEAGKIDWENETAEQIDRKIRALNPQIKTFTFAEKNGQKKRVNVLESVGILKDSQDSVRDETKGQYGLFNKNLSVTTKKDLLLVGKLQVEGKSPITPSEFVQGYSDGRFSSQ